MSDYVLPTPYGNVIAAAEQYPKRLFNMDTVVLWPYLVPILTKNGYAEYVVREKAAMDFLLNLTLMVGIFGILLATSEIIYADLSLMLGLKLFIVGGIFLALFTLAVWGAEGWAGTVSTAFVLFRDDLRQALRLRPVKDYDDERLLWEHASNFLRAKDSLQRQRRWGGRIFEPKSPNASGGTQDVKNEQT